MTCRMCDGTGKRLRYVDGGCVSELVDCFACGGSGRREGGTAVDE